MPSRENSYKGYSPPKCTCNVHLTFTSTIPNKICNPRLEFYMSCHEITHAPCPSPYRLPTYSSPYRLPPHNIMPMCDKTHHLWITSNDHFTKQIHLFSNQKLFGCYTSMIIYIQNSCVFCGQRIFVSHRRLYTPIHFLDFHLRSV